MKRKTTKKEVLNLLQTGGVLLRAIHSDYQRTWVYMQQLDKSIEIHGNTYNSLIVNKEIMQVNPLKGDPYYLRRYVNSTIN